MSAGDIFVRDADKRIAELQYKVDSLLEAIRQHKKEVTKTCSDGGPDIRLWEILEQEQNRGLYETRKRPRHHRFENAIDKLASLLQEEHNG